MKLKFIKRTAERKSDAKKLRREGEIPAALYVKGKPTETISLNMDEFEGLLRQIKQGRLCTTKFSLVDEKGKVRTAIIKDIQYHVTNYNIIHLDFEELLDDVKVNVNVPIECVGVMDCPGIKLGGTLRQVIRNLRVQCLPKYIPDAFELDTRTLGVRDARRLKDLEIPKEVRPLADLNEVCIVIAKR